MPRGPIGVSSNGAYRKAQTQMEVMGFVETDAKDVEEVNKIKGRRGLPRRIHG